MAFKTCIFFFRQNNIDYAAYTAIETRRWVIADFYLVDTTCRNLGYKFTVALYAVNQDKDLLASFQGNVFPEVDTEPGYQGKQVCSCV